MKNPLKFIQEVKQEAFRVTWPTGKETLQGTLMVVEMAIVEFNPKSFRNRNPNFLFANQNLYLPSLNEMKNLVLGKSNKKLQPEQINDTSSHIYFFGG